MSPQRFFAVFEYRPCIRSQQAFWSVSAPSFILTGTAVAICVHITGRIVHSPSFRPSGSRKPPGGIFLMPHWSSRQIKPRSPLSCSSMSLTMPPLYSPGCAAAILGCTLRYGQRHTRVHMPSSVPLDRAVRHDPNCIIEGCRSCPTMSKLLCRDSAGCGMGRLC